MPEHHLFEPGNRVIEIQPRPIELQDPRFAVALDDALIDLLMLV